MVRIFSKDGLSKDLCSKVACGINISEDDTRSAVLCRGGVTFVDKMDQFIRRAQSVGNTPSDLKSEHSAKRCVQLSPSSHQPSKRLSKVMPGRGDGVPSYMCYIGMCRCEGYGFRAVYSGIGYINQRV